MIRWILAVFYLLNSLTTLNRILIINLPIVVICRAIFIGSFYLRYRPLFTGREREFAVFFPNDFLVYFVLKELVIISGGILYFPISLGIAVYSLIHTGELLKNHGENMGKKPLSIVGSFIRCLIPLIAIIYYITQADYLLISAIAISLLLYILIGIKRGRLSISGLKEKYFTSRLNTSKVGKVFHAFSFIFLLGFSLSVLTGISVYSTPERRTFYVEMSDGVKLATDVYYSPGSFGTAKPVILVRTPYGKTGWAYDLYSLFYFIQDYHVVFQDLRGTYDSEGGQNFLLFTMSYLDGVDTVEWIMDRPWCNGKIGSVGVSALCINQYFYAGMNPDGLSAQSLWFGTPELFDHAIYQGSYHESSVETWIESTASDNYDYQISTIFDYFPKNTMYNSTSLSMPIGPHYSNISVSALHVGGWHDHFLQGTLDGYVGYDDYGGSAARGRQKLIMGPWTHGNVFSTKQGQLTFPDNSKGFDLIFNWEQSIFDEALRGVPTDWSGARVAYYLMGDVDQASSHWNYWRYAYDWPLDHVNTSFYMHKGGVLDKTAPTSAYNYSYLFDPRDPVETLGGQNQPFDTCGPYDQRSIENRSDVLLFESEELTESFETVGRIWGHLYVSSNCSDTDFTVKLTDVYPDGRSMLITDGSLTVRSRNGYTNEDFMTGNKTDVYELLVDCWSTAYSFAPGHKIRVAISSSNYPRFGLNPNTGAPLAESYLSYNIANNTLCTGPMYNSSIIFPQLVNMDTTHVFY